MGVAGERQAHAVFGIRYDFSGNAPGVSYWWR